MSLGIDSLESALPLAALAPIALWTALAQAFWGRRRDGEVWLPAAISALIAAQITVEMLSELGRPDLEGTLTMRLLVTFPFVTEVLAVCLFRHLALVVSGAIPRAPRTGSAWLAANYGVGLTVAVGLAIAVLVGRLAAPRAQLFVGTFGWSVGLYTFWQLRREVRGGRVKLARLLGHVHYVDLILVGTAVLLYIGMEALGRSAVVVEAIGDLCIGATFALRAPRIVLRQVASVSTALLAAALAVIVMGTISRDDTSEGVVRLVAIACVLGLAALLLGGRRIADRLLFGTDLGSEEIQVFLRGLPAELGTLECCRRALAWICARTPVRGAAILLRDGSEAAHGDLDLAPVRSVWPLSEAASALPTRPFGVIWLRSSLAQDGGASSVAPRPDAEALQNALVAAEIVSVFPIVSPRRRWGDLFFTARRSGLAFALDDVASGESFADQLALVLDAADLLARTVAVERSLAHAEKLAAIGETAARIAHEIRNPIAAARSLAQQLAREPGAPFAEEHEVILGELERVERLVADLLRFSRREEPSLGDVDLGTLIRTTIDRLRSRLDRAGIHVTVATEDGVNVQGDRDTLARVVVNLVENAADALEQTDPDARRWIAVHLERRGRVAALRVADGGPGAPPEVVQRLFEPFFTRKSHGTGLGLAIVKRTIEAHGGRIDVARDPEAGLVFDIEIPLAHAGPAGG